MRHKSFPAPAQTALADAACGLLSTMAGLAASNQARICELQEAEHEAQSWLHRRAARNIRDRHCYRIGAALEPNDGHLIDDVFLAGFDHLGAFAVLFLVPHMLAAPGRAFSDYLRLLSDTEEGHLIRDWGVWARAVWNRALYIDETVTFLQSKTGSDPKEKWRRGRVTRRQHYLIIEIARWLKIPEPTFKTRGEAFEWIKIKGGNPRFHTVPPQPPLPTIPEVL